MRLRDLIDEHREEIQDFEDFARRYTRPGEGVDVAALRDHAEGLLEAMILHLGQPQTADDQERKSKGAAPRLEGAPLTQAERHGIQRASEAFSLSETVAEFRCLAGQHPSRVGPVGREGRRNRSLQRGDEVKRAKTDFLQMVSHELRTPPHAITGYNQLLTEGSDWGSRSAASSRTG